MIALQGAKVLVPMDADEAMDLVLAELKGSAEDFSLQIEDGSTPKAAGRSPNRRKYIRWSARKIIDAFLDWTKDGTPLPPTRAGIAEKVLKGLSVQRLGCWMKKNETIRKCVEDATRATGNVKRGEKSSRSHSARVIADRFKHNRHDED